MEQSNVTAGLTPNANGNKSTVTTKISRRKKRKMIRRKKKKTTLYPKKIKMTLLPMELQGSKRVTPKRERSNPNKLEKKKEDLRKMTRDRGLQVLIEIMSTMSMQLAVPKTKFNLKSLTLNSISKINF